MATNHHITLSGIKRFNQLVRYLRDSMDWPIMGNDFEEVTFDYTPGELGIDAKNAAKIQEIKRLRPLTVNQPWGIFFVKFEPKRLPVVALRRILSQVAIKKRASANASEHQVWAADDLLFISSYGEGEERKITFANFSAPQDGQGLSTLRVLGWDSGNTVLHLEDVAEKLTNNLAWPADDKDEVKWREQWRSAFTLRHREVITTSQKLSECLAELARTIRDRIRLVLSIETENGPLTKLLKAFQQVLVHDLTSDGFSDMYAQTIAYGLLSARIADPQKKTAGDFAAHMRTNPFLRELMETFLQVGGRRGKAEEPGVDFDELGISEVVDLLNQADMEAVVRDFGDRNPEEDPVIHFYEDFLEAYDKKQKVNRGVFYTPRPVVSYIVRSVDALLRARFGLQDGLADTATWGEMADRHPDLDFPEGVLPGQNFVQILDPATGTGTFLVEIIDLIHKTLVTKWENQGCGAEEIEVLWNEYVPKHLLPRLHGYELLMAPYAIAHLKIGLKLYETGYRFGGEERARVYLTNALDPGHDSSNMLGLTIPALAHEVEAVNEVKQRSRFTVIVGNPPYSLFSANTEPHHKKLVEAYTQVDGKPIQESHAGQFSRNLNDDYIKFISITQRAIKKSGLGVSGLITNHSFLDGPTLRGLRKSLLNGASHIWLVDLHGNSRYKQQGQPPGMPDENVFDIQQGVAISLCVKLPEATEEFDAFYHASWGTRRSKEKWLAEHCVLSHNWQKIFPTFDHYLFIPHNSSLKEEFEAWPSLPKMMPVYSAGYITARDKFVIDFNKNSVTKRISAFNASLQDDASLLKEFNVSAKKGWNVSRARSTLKHKKISQHVIRTNYRPFDSRWIFFDETLVWSPAWITTKHVIKNPSNLTLLATRTTKDKWDVWVARTVSSHKAMSAAETNSVFPLYLIKDFDALLKNQPRDNRINYSVPFLESLASRLNLDHGGTYGLPTGLMPEDIFYYAYGVFCSPGYRSRYSELLRFDFPRLPLARDLELFRALARLGGDLVALHLMESSKLENPTTVYKGKKNPVIRCIGWFEDSVWLDSTKTRGGIAISPGTNCFCGVPKEVWDFYVGGYQACHKWLKDRKDCSLSSNDIVHFQKVVAAISETIRITGEIDEVIENYGGWPNAF